MSDTNPAQLRRLDFMLLLVLTEGVRRRKLSEVARHLGVTQTAISHSVARLRDLFGDELFIRRPHGVEPTARAQALAAAAERVLDDASALLADPAPFDPAGADRTLRVAALDFEVTLLSETIQDMRRTAPGLSLHFVGMGRDTAIAALEEGALALWLGFARRLPPTLETVLLFEEGYAVIARAGHPRLGAPDGAPLGLDAYCAEVHVVAAPGGTAGGIVDKTLRRVGRTRTVGVTTTGFLSVLDLVARSDMIATVPARLARMQAETFRLTMRPPPIAPRPFAVSATWHRRAARDPAIGWVVETLRGALGERA
jgi:DNA-binding transcriptional LysR family regulator